LRIIQDHSVRLGRLTDDLLKLSRIEAGKKELDLRPLDVSELLESCAETSRFKVEEKRLTLEVVKSADMPPVLGDERALGEVLQNLLDNAIQYTPAGGRITMSATRAAGRIKIAVTDTGVGIAQAHIDRIFERFYRVDPARSREVGGTGLGLAIAKHLVEAQGGEIAVESTVGLGSTFFVYMPIG
jgi:two-component system phosphate regulon sensor histidine kinase PhoR